MKVNDIQIQKIKLLILDVDGVLTDGGLYFCEQGTEIKRFNALDGHGIKMLKDNGVEVAVITARDSKIAAQRMKNLGIIHFYQGQSDKLVAFNELLQTLNLSADQVSYVGDDVIDLPVMTKVGFAVAVANAHDMVKQHADLTTEKLGGHGAVREVCDFILKAQDKFDGTMKSYLSEVGAFMRDFENLCYETLKAKVPAGRVITYGGLAKLMNCPGAAQSVGQAMKKNPFSEVPCHRVVRKNGEVGYFTQEGIQMITQEDILKKIELLQEEGVFVKQKEGVLEKSKIVNFSQICI